MAQAPTDTNPPPPERNKQRWRRPNPSRAVEIFGEFTDEMGCRVLSQINQLRSQSNAPITIYINSIGGSVLVLKYINGLLDSCDLDKEFCNTVTVASGTAASAGAILLAYGDYAYAYEHSLIHFHSIRTSDLPETFQDAAHVLRTLERSQRDVAKRLSLLVIRRVIFRYQKLQDKFNHKRTDVNDKELIRLRCFLDSITPELSSKARSLVEMTYGNVKEARFLTAKVLPKNIDRSRTPVRSDAKVLIKLIKHEIADREARKKRWRIDERGAAQILSDYLAIRDYNLGEHNRIMGGLMKTFGEDFLTETEKVKFRKIQSADTKKARMFLWETVYPRLEPLWYYTVCLCRTLLEDENRLTPSDAFWMGIIDEVIGTDLVGFRVVEEEPQKPKSPTSSSTSPARPASQSLPASAPTTQRL